MKSPAFFVDPSKISFLGSPAIFADTLVDLFSSAKKRVYFTTLYIGTDKAEAKVIDALIRRRNESGNKLDVLIMFDMLRGTRMVKNSSSCHIVKPLVNSNADIALFRSSSDLFLSKRLPSPMNEIFGTQHMKIFVIDDKTIITGANLSDQYLRNRRDRYILIEDKSLADYCAKVVTHFANTYSHKLVPTASLDILPDEMKKDNISEFDADKSLSIIPPKKFIEESLVDDLVSSGLILSPHSNEADSKSSNHEYPTEDPTQIKIQPMIQYGPGGLRCEESALLQYLDVNNKSSSSDSKSANIIPNQFLTLASGYLNPPDEIIERLNNLINSGEEIQLVGAAPKSNSFFTAKGAAGMVPLAYSVLAAETIEKLKGKASYFEWAHAGWTFHAKGLWRWRKDENGVMQIDSTVIGSSNFARRSWEKDLEFGLIIEGKGEELNKKLNEEFSNMMLDAKLIKNSEVIERLPLWGDLFNWTFLKFGQLRKFL